MDAGNAYGVVAAAAPSAEPEAGFGVAAPVEAGTAEAVRAGTTAARKPLTWSLVVSTFKREKVLPRCVRCALASTRRPAEVIIVDASPYWATTRDAVLAEFEAANPDVHFVYVGARRASLTAQRNQGLEMTTGDVAFMLDDDSLVYPDTAERVMRVYDADVNNEVVALTPVFVAEPPDLAAYAEAADQPKRGHVAVAEGQAPWIRRLMRGMLWSGTQLLPYDERVPVATKVPGHLSEMNLIPVSFSSGSATFRTEIVRQAGFEEVLERYAAGEDWDISERIRGYGMIAFVSDARQCHLEAAGGRLSRRTVTTLRYLNFMALHVMHSTDVRRSRRLYRQMLWRRVLSDLLADLGKRRWDLSRAKGAWRALRMLPEMFSKTAAQMRAWYPGLQQRIIAADQGEERPR